MRDIFKVIGQVIWYCLSSFWCWAFLVIFLFLFGFIPLIEEANSRAATNLLMVTEEEGRLKGVMEVRVEAVRRGHAEWVVTNEYGAVEFKWVDIEKSCTE